MQGAEIKDEGSVLKYMTKSEIDEQRSSLHIMTQRLFYIPIITRTSRNATTSSSGDDPTVSLNNP